MKTRGLLVAGMTMALGSGLAQAEGIYAGIKGGAMTTGLSGFDNGANVGVLIGYEFTPQPAAMAVEAEYTTSVSEGDAPGGNEWEVDTFAVYGAVRYGEDLYFKAKAGFIDGDISVGNDFGRLSTSDFGGSAGIGGGWRMTDRTSVELEYTFIEEDIDFYSIGLMYRF